MTPIILSFGADGTARTVYTEGLDLEQIGALSVRRASTVEFNDATQLWEVRWEGSPEVVFSHPSRAECIRWEVQQLNAKLHE